ncbi:BZ3500_MvSof-1268-A1-R1_Chr2-2g05099 [Microbotryum saponariae]|uniref:BZ3500_MvSof-1268-A1-R1_Chr2-2g05099 protein n=1 Tax=Microbotryum saponariae TaxID=289078 RepID=A0A2X0KX39_9BASI|nr:BZ3500_MvSof-1268-A1-R1_Chr2-2g05099 [Microbotryum saponariae]SDA00909.1 BZ3501_MvSof-1269-A2-R1_Chr2-2g04773 [Microbotryum saponariae]
MADETKTIYVGGFSSETSATILESAFLPFGQVVDIQLPRDPVDKSRHRGFAFVSFSSLESALDAIDNMHQNELTDPSNKGRTLKVNMAKPPKGLQPGMGNRASQSTAPSCVSPTTSEGATDRSVSFRAVWTDEAWIKEHGMQSIEDMHQQVGTAGP